MEFYFLSREGITGTNTSLFFFSLFLGESFHTLIYIRCIYDVIFFGIVLILEEVAYYQNALCYIAHHTHHN